MSQWFKDAQTGEQPSKHEKVKMIMARIAIAAILLSVIAACICMAVGSFEMVMIACFCLVIVPIMIYGFIIVYDNIHKDDKESAELLKKLEEQSAEGDAKDSE